jgi:hypothetical protein
MTARQLDLQQELMHFATTFRINSVEAVNQGLGLGLFVNPDRGRSEQSLRQSGFTKQSLSYPRNADAQRSPAPKERTYKPSNRATKEALNLKVPANARNHLFGALVVFSKIALRKVCAFSLDFLFLLSTITLSIRAIAALLALRGVELGHLIDSIEFSQHYLVASGALGSVVLLYFIFFRVFLGKTVGDRVAQAVFGAFAKRQG